MLKIGVVGLGNIAQKAYLPVMAEMQAKVDWFLCTRNPEKLADLQARYRFNHGTTQLTELFEQSLDAIFIHTPTKTHYTLVKQALTVGLHVFVDKPLSENPAEVAELYRLAKKQNKLLTVGFNRRFAPQIEKVKYLPSKQLINVTKTRIATGQTTSFAIYDLMIHVIDTAVFIGQVKAPHFTPHIYCKQDANGQLLQAQLQLACPQQLITATLNMQAGTNQESAKVQTQFGTYQIDNLTRLSHQTTTDTQISTPSDWSATLENRGFAPLIRAFINALETEGQNPVSPESSLLTHQLCQQVVQYASTH